MKTLGNLALTVIIGLVISAVVFTILQRFTGIKPVGSLVQGTPFAVAAYWTTLLGGLYVGRKISDLITK